MAKLFLLRHLKSQWNEENRFSGWADICLQPGQAENARILCGKIFKYNIDAIYTSELFRNMETVAKILECTEKYPIFTHLDKGKMQKWGNYIDLSEGDIPVYVSESLNERYYGKLQGQNKQEAMKKYGSDQVHLWRRSYNIAPPGGESLKDVCKRTSSFFNKHIAKKLKEGKNILVVASHNSLRALAKEIEHIPDKEIIDFEITFGGLLEYELDENLHLKSKSVII